MNGLSENQKRILDYLLDHKEGATLDELASHLGISKTAAKEHLRKVESLGYLSHVDSRGRVGRPRRRYLLSPDGYEAFPKQYSWLSNVLLEQLASELGPEGVSRLMGDLADQVAAPMKEDFRASASTVEMLKKVTATLNELGYRARLKQSDVRKGAVVEASHCVYHSLAQRHPALCRFDIRFLENISGLDVKLETCIARGGSVCRFCLRKTKSG